MFSRVVPYIVNFKTSVFMASTNVFLLLGVIFYNTAASLCKRFVNKRLVKLSACITSCPPARFSDVAKVHVGNGRAQAQPTIFNTQP